MHGGPEEEIDLHSIVGTRECCMTKTASRTRFG